MVAHERQEKQYTADDLWDLSHSGDDQRYELDEGELVEMSPTGDSHGIITNWFAFLITGYVDAHDLGEVTAAETGFILATKPRYIVRAPDIGFISKARLKPLTGKYYPIAPDLAVEIVSPNDKAIQIRRKVRQFLRAGTLLMWVGYPEDRLVDIFRPGQPTIHAEIDDILDGGDVLPGFSLPVRDVFKKLRD